MKSPIMAISISLILLPTLVSSDIPYVPELARSSAIDNTGYSLSTNNVRKRLEPYPMKGSIANEPGGKKHLFDKMQSTDDERQTTDAVSLQNVERDLYSVETIDLGQPCMSMPLPMVQIDRIDGANIDDMPSDDMTGDDDKNDDTPFDDTTDDVSLGDDNYDDMSISFDDDYGAIPGSSASRSSSKSGKSGKSSKSKKSGKSSKSKTSGKSSKSKKSSKSSKSSGSSDMESSPAVEQGSNFTSLSRVSGFVEFADALDESSGSYLCPGKIASFAFTASLVLLHVFRPKQ